MKGNLYGTTAGGGTANSGVIFKIASDGSYRVLYNFHVRTTVASLFGGVLLLNGYLYGTAPGGSRHGYGTGVPAVEIGRRSFKSAMTFALRFESI